MLSLFNFPLTDKEIDAIRADDVELLSQLDSFGIIVGSNETLVQFKNRVKLISVNIKKLQNSIINNTLDGNLRKLGIELNNIIDSKVYIESSKLTSRYSFYTSWVPGFFCSRALGLLTGGVTLSSNDGDTVFILRSVFKHKLKWLFYCRDELLAHELCHAVRSPVDDNSFEEFFAYKISKSWLRRKIGGMFTHIYDSIIFLLPFILLMVVQVTQLFISTQINMLYFWLLCLPYPLYLFTRHQLRSKKFNQASRALDIHYGISSDKIDSILFRCNETEINEIGQLVNSKVKLNSYLQQKISLNLKWKIIHQRFLKDVC